MTRTKNENRVFELERFVPEKESHFMVCYDDWLPGKEPPPEQIEVFVSYLLPSKKKPEKMTLAEYRERFPNWEEHEVIHVAFEDEPIEDDMG